MSATTTRRTIDSARSLAVVSVALVIGATALSCTAASSSGGPSPMSPEFTDQTRTVAPEMSASLEPSEPTSTPRPVRDEWPGADDTGPVDVEALEPVDQQIRIDSPRTVIEDVDIRGHIDIRASDVTVRNFRVDAGGALYGIQVRPGLSGVVIEDGEIAHSGSAGVYCQSACTLRRLHVHDHAADGMKLSGTNGPSLVEDSYITRLGAADGSHADGNQSVSGTNLTFRHNTFDMPVPGSGAHDAMSLPEGVPEFNSNAAFIIHEGTDNILIEENWLNGGNYTIYGYRGTTVRNNIFGPDFQHGICNGPFEDWSANVMEDGTPAGEGSCA